MSNWGMKQQGPSVATSMYVRDDEVEKGLLVAAAMIYSNHGVELPEAVDLAIGLMNTIRKKMDERVELALNVC